MRAVSPSEVEEALPGIAAHPHAGAVLGAALPPAGRPSHAYLLHGPAGAGKRALARAFAAALLAEGAHGGRDARAVAERARRGAHPDLTWVRPSGASEMLVGDIDQPVVAAAARTPFEAGRRVFVIEAAETLNEQAANRLLKTLEEPPPYAHLLLVSDRREEVMATIASRCVHVRFEAPPPEAIARELLAEGLAAGEPVASACARLALGDGRRARMLAGESGAALRAAAEGYVREALAGDTERRGWTILLEAARAAGAGAGGRVSERVAVQLERAPSRARKRLEREAQENRRRVERRARAGALEEGLRLVELWLRDILCLQAGAEELVHAVDRRAELERDAAARPREVARRGLELVRETRTRLALNVGEELALEALAFRLRALAEV
jgi:DNA polymerase-3 subunit delta'